jgi:hypothetical protein
MAKQGSLIDMGTVMIICISFQLFCGNALIYGCPFLLSQNQRLTPASVDNKKALHTGANLKKEKKQL